METVGPVACRQVQQGLERLGLGGDGRPGVPPPVKQVGNGPDGQLLGVDRVHLVPRQRRGDLATHPRPGEPGAEDRLVGGVLIEVDEDPSTPLLLPPVGGDQVRMPSLELPGQGDSARAHREAVPARLEPGVDVEAPTAGGLGIGGDAQLLQKGAHTDRRLPDLAEGGAGLWVEVDSELVGVALVVRPVGPQVEPEAPQVDSPQDVSDVGDDQGVRRRPVGGGDHGGLQPVRSPGRHPLLEEGLAAGSLGEPLEHGGTSEGGHPQPFGHRHVVGGQLEFGGTQIGEVDLVRIGDLDCPTRHLDGAGPFGGHHPTLSGRTTPITCRRRPLPGLAPSPDPEIGIVGSMGPSGNDDRSGDLRRQ